MMVNKNRIVLTLVLVAVLAAGIGAYLVRGGQRPTQMPSQLRMPVSNPPLEPTRPDLIGEPVIGERDDDDPDPQS